MFQELGVLQNNYQENSFCVNLSVESLVQMLDIIEKKNIFSKVLGFPPATKLKLNSLTSVVLKNDHFSEKFFRMYVTEIYVLKIMNTVILFAAFCLPSAVEGVTRW